MPTKKRRKKGFNCLRLLLLFSLAVLIFWFFRNDVTGLADWVKRKLEIKSPAKPSEEKILDLERKELEKILKGR